MQRLRSFKESARCLVGSKKRVVFLALVCLAFFYLIEESFRNYQYLIGMYHDDSVYLVCAKALAEGLNYKIISLPGEPYETKYPSGFPGLLSLIWLIAGKFPQNLPIFETFQIVIAVLSVLGAVLYLLATRRVTPFFALAALAATVLNCHFTDFAPMVMSDLPCALIAVIALWQTEIMVRRGYTPKRAAWLGFLFATACAYRAQGLVVATSCVVFLAIKKEFRLAAVSFVVFWLLLVPGFIWQKVYQGTAPPYYNFYTNYIVHAYQTLPSSSDWYPAMMANYNWSGILQVNTYFPFITRIPYESLPPFVFELIYRVGYLLLGVPLLVGGFLEWRKGSLPALYGFFYGWSLAYWPVKLEWRHILPLLVFNYYFYLRGFRSIARLLKQKMTNRNLYRQFCNCMLVAFCLYLVLGTFGEAYGRATSFARSLLSADPLTNPAIVHADYQEAVHWITQNTDKKDVFVCNNDPVLYLYTGRQAVGNSRLEMWRFIFDKLVDPPSMVESIVISKARYVMNEPTYRSMGYGYKQAATAIALLQNQMPGLLTPVYNSPHNLVQVYCVDATKIPAPATQPGSK